MQRLRRISQLQSARWVFPTAEHSRFTHGLGVMHEAGLWARPSTRACARRCRSRPASRSRPKGSWSRRCGSPVCSTTSGHGPFAHFFDDHVLAAFRPRPIRAVTVQAADPRGPLAADHRGRAGLAHRGLRRAPGAVPERDALADDEQIDPRWVSFLVSKPRSPTRRCRAGSAGCNRSCRASSPSTTSTTSAGTPT